MQSGSQCDVMDEAKRQLLFSAWQSLPEGIRFPAASESELQKFEAEHGSIPSDYRWFLAEFGGGVVGSEWVDSIARLSDTHRKFRSEFGPPKGWSMQDVFVIGWDGAGNPFGIHRRTGQMLVEDHNFGGIHELAESFEAFLISGLLKEEH